ncbi:MAG TPA: GNAT family N-acetyltransferase [Segetibacter sp.]|jgi:ribosomal protein S18 acetylase RimI-like enzyme
MEITIEAVKESDVETLAAVSRNTFQDTFGKQNTEENMNMFLQTTFNIAAIKNEFNSTKNQFYFAKVKDKIAGYIKVSDNKKPEELKSIAALEIARIYAVKEMIGLGIGKLMLRFVIELAKKTNKKVIWLGVWEQNKRAIKFYQSFGFEKFGEHIFMVGNDPQIDWLMKLDL